MHARQVSACRWLRWLALLSQQSSIRSSRNALAQTHERERVCVTESISDQLRAVRHLGDVLKEGSAIQHVRAGEDDSLALVSCIELCNSSRLLQRHAPDDEDENVL